MLRVEVSVMGEPRELHCYEYVPIPYAKVRDALSRDAAGIFQRATATATSRAEELVANLRVSIGVLEVGADVAIDIGSVAETTTALGDPIMRLDLAWKATRAEGLFPSMEATLSVYPLSAKETQLDLLGRYRPPLGIVGNAADALIGHRIAEASVLRFVQEVAARLCTELSASPG
jgi:hypothetical protein